MGNDQNQQDPFAQATQPDLPVTRDATERIFGMGVRPGGSLEKALIQHHTERAAQAEMYRKVAADALGILHTGDKPKNPQTGAYLTPDEIDKLTQQKDYALQQYGKLVGVNKDAKGALEKAHGIIDFITGAKQRQAQMAAPPTPNYPTTVGDAGVFSGPTPQYSTNVSEAGVTQDPRLGGMAPPPAPPRTKDQAREDAYRQKLSLLESSITAPFNQQGVAFNTKLEQDRRTKEAQYSMWEEEAKRIGLAPGSREYKYYSATGKMPATGNMQLKPVQYRDENGKIQRVLANYDPKAGTATTLEGKEITNPEVVDKPQNIRYMKYDQAGKPHLVGGFSVGMGYYDANMNPLPANTEFFLRGLQGRDTLRQQITYGPDGPIVNTLETISQPKMEQAIWADEDKNATPPPVSSTAPAGAAPTAGAIPAGRQGIPAPPAAPKAGAAKPEVTGSGVPIVKGGGGAGRAPKATDALGRPLGVSAGMYNTQTAIVRPIREASNQIFGDPTQPDMKSMKDFSNLADDPAARERLAKAFKITFDGLKGDEKKSGGLWELIQTYGGMPQALAGARANVREDVIGALKDHPDEMEAYDTTMNAYGSIVGMRAINKASATDMSVSKLEQELPLVGLNSMSSKQYNDQLSRLAENVYGASRTLFDTVLPKAEKEYIKAQVSSLKKQSRGGGATPPPTPGAGAKSVDDQIMELIGPSKKKP